jgi:hypothetical protein
MVRKTLTTYSGNELGGQTTLIWAGDGTLVGSTQDHILLGPLTVAASLTHFVGFDLSHYTGSTNLHLWAVPPDDTGIVLAVNGGPQTVTMAAPGHEPEARFSHGAAQQVTVRVEWNPAELVWHRGTNSGVPNSIFLEVRQGAPPGGTVLGSASSHPNNSPIVRSVTLPAAGTYMVRLFNDLDARGPFQVRVNQP